MANVNLVTNPSFEVNTTGWTFTGATGSRDTYPHVVMGSRSGSAKLVATGGAPMTAATTVSGLTVGANYTVSFYGKISGASNFSVVADVNGHVVGQRPFVSGDTFGRRVMGFKATATTATVTITTEINNVAGDTLWLDNVMVNQDTLLPYFDGSYPYSSWTGTAHASTSTNSVFATSLAGYVTTDEVIVVNGLCLNTMAWNVTSKTGRFTVPVSRGEDITVPSATGRTFVPNKPLDAGLFTLSMFVLGCLPDGTIPPDNQSEFVKNFEQILRQCFNPHAPLTIYNWKPNGSVRMAKGTLIGADNAIDPTMYMGGARGEMVLPFEILSGVWSDFFTTSIQGTPSASWSNQTLSLTPLADGTAYIEDAVITVTGPITNPVVSNSVTNTSVTLTGSVPAGQTWTIDCGAWTSVVNGSSVLQNTTHSGHSRFLLIDAGSLSGPPSVTLSGSGTTTATNLSITAARKHLVG